MQTDFEKFGDLIQDIRIAMVTTVRTDGSLHSRPLSTLKYDRGDELFFFIAIDSPKVNEVDEDMHVSVAYADNAGHKYVAVTGMGVVYKDRQKEEELWTPFAKAWFPEGLDDPKLALLRVNIERAEYWTSPGKAAYLFGIAKASLTGKPTKMGENQKLTM